MGEGVVACGVEAVPIGIAEILEVILGESDLSWISEHSLGVGNEEEQHDTIEEEQRDASEEGVAGMVPQLGDVVEHELVVQEEDQEEHEENRHHEGCLLYFAEVWLQDHYILIPYNSLTCSHLQAATPTPIRLAPTSALPTGDSTLLHLMRAPAVTNNRPIAPEWIPLRFQSTPVFRAACPSSPSGVL